MFTLVNIKIVFGVAMIVSLVLSLSQVTRPPTTTAQHLPIGLCLVDGKIYNDGEMIHRDPENCYFSRCSGGGIVAHGDNMCFLYGQPYCEGQLVDIPGQCCHVCLGYRTTTTSTTRNSLSLPYGACILNGKIYMNDGIIHRDPENCYFSICISGGIVVHGHDRCFLYGQPHCDGQLVDIPGQCCHECREYKTTTTSTTKHIQSLPPGACIVNGNVYMNGGKISGDSEDCTGSICSDGSEMFWDDKCFLSGQPDCSNGHLVDIPGQCCHECIKDITTVPPSAIVG